MNIIIKYSSCKTVQGNLIHDFEVFLDNIRLRGFSTIGGHTSVETQKAADTYAKSIANKLNLLILRQNLN